MRYAARAKADTKRLSDWLAMLDRLHLALDRSSVSLPDALTASADADAWPDGLFRSLADALRANPAMSLHDVYIQHKANELHPESAVIDRLTESLGRGSLESRMLAVEHARADIRLMHDAYAARSARDAPMYMRLGWTAGACLLILLM